MGRTLSYQQWQTSKDVQSLQRQRGPLLIATNALQIDTIEDWAALLRFLLPPGNIVDYVIDIDYAECPIIVFVWSVVFSVYFRGLAIASGVTSLVTSFVRCMVLVYLRLHIVELWSGVLLLKRFVCGPFFVIDCEIISIQKIIRTINWQLKRNCWRQLRVTSFKKDFKK